MFTVDTNLVKAAQLFTADKDEVRDYLRGFCVEPHPNGGVTVTGSNGHMLFVAYDPLGYTNKEQTTILVDGKLLQKDTKLVYNDENNELSVEMGQVLLRRLIPVVEFTVYDFYPAWRRVVPKITGDYQSYGLPHLNSKYLAILEKVPAVLGASKKKMGNFTVRLTSTGKNSAVVARFGFSPNVFAIIVSIKCDDDLNKYPYWFIS